MKDLKTRLANAVKSLREEDKMTQEEFLKAIKRPTLDIKALESATDDPKKRDIIAILNYLDKDRAATFLEALH